MDQETIFNLVKVLVVPVFLILLLIAFLFRGIYTRENRPIANSDLFLWFKRKKHPEEAPALKALKTANAHVLTGGAYIRLQQYDQALQSLDRAIELSPDYAGAYLNRALLHIQTKTYEKALQDANTLITLEPKTASGYQMRGLVYMLLKQPILALSDLEQAQTLDPKSPNPPYHFLIGNVHIQLKQYPQAIHSFTQALAIDPNNATAHHNKGYAHIHLKQYPQAIHHSTQALYLDPNNTTHHHNIGSALLALNQIEQGRASLGKSLILKPDHICSLWLSEWCNLCFDPFDSAIITRLEKAAAIEIDEDSHEYVHKPLCHGVALWLQQNYQDALISIDQAIVIEPDNNDAHFWRGMALAALGRDEEARVAFEFARENGTPLCLFQTLRLLEPLNKPFYQQYSLSLQQN